MRHGSCFLLVTCLLSAAPACFLDTTDDDDGAESGNETGMATAGSASGATAGETRGTATGSGSADGSTAGDETAAAGACGWGPTGDQSVPEGYVCGGEGADPSDAYPMLCPADVTLAVGGACGSIEGSGCCDADGNAWYCGEQGNGPALAQIEC